MVAVNAIEGCAAALNRSSRCSLVKSIEVNYPTQVKLEDEDRVIR